LLKIRNKIWKIIENSRYLRVQTLRVQRFRGRVHSLGPLPWPITAPGERSRVPLTDQLSRMEVPLAKIPVLARAVARVSGPPPAPGRGPPTLPKKSDDIFFAHQMFFP